MNKVCLVGRITKDPELRQSAGGKPYVFFTIAINRIGLQNGERVADFISCVAWNRQAENLCRFIRKGGLIGVDGRLQTRTVTDNGVNRTVMDVYCDMIHFLESKNANDAQQNMSNSYDNYYGGQQQMSQPQMQRPQYNKPNQNNYNNFNNNYSNYQANNGSTPRRNEPSNDNPFAGEVKSQFDISDDDLPF